MSLFLFSINGVRKFNLTSGVSIANIDARISQMPD